MQKKPHITVLIVILLLAGTAILLYPTVSNWLAKRRNVSEISMYETGVGQYSTAAREQEWKKAEEYNDSLLGTPVKDPFIPGSGMSLPQNYLSVLNTDGIMAYIEIPSLNIKLPIYHGVSEPVLQKGIGHMEGTALPIGSSGGHALLTGHTGLPSAKLFTDLIQMEIGDRFYIHVLGKELVYEVDQITVIEPEDVSSLQTKTDTDRVTLITCTPYGINSHRLLVQGIRTNILSKRIIISQHTSYWYLPVFIISILAAVVLCIVLGVRRAKIKKQIRRFQRKKLLHEWGKYG